jgi:hypothetical protein
MLRRLRIPTLVFDHCLRPMGHVAQRVGDPGVDHTRQRTATVPPCQPMGPAANSAMTGSNRSRKPTTPAPATARSRLRPGAGRGPVRPATRTPSAASRVRLPRCTSLPASGGQGCEERPDDVRVGPAGLHSIGTRVVRPGACPAATTRDMCFADDTGRPDDVHPLASTPQPQPQGIERLLPRAC